MVRKGHCVGRQREGEFVMWAAFCFVFWLFGLSAFAAGGGGGVAAAAAAVLALGPCSEECLCVCVSVCLSVCLLFIVKYFPQ